MITDSTRLYDADNVFWYQAYWLRKLHLRADCVSRYQQQPATWKQKLEKSLQHNAIYPWLFPMRLCKTWMIMEWSMAWRSMGHEWIMDGNPITEALIWERNNLSRSELIYWNREAKPGFTFGDHHFVGKLGIPLIHMYSYKVFILNVSASTVPFMIF